MQNEYFNPQVIVAFFLIALALRAAWHFRPGWAHRQMQRNAAKYHRRAKLARELAPICEKFGWDQKKAQYEIRSRQVAYALPREAVIEHLLSEQSQPAA